MLNEQRPIRKRVQWLRVIRNTLHDSAMVRNKQIQAFTDYLPISVGNVKTLRGNGKILLYHISLLN